MSLLGNILWLIDRLLLQADRHGDREGDGARVAEPGVGHEIPIQRQLQRLQHQLSMRRTDLVAVAAVYVGRFPSGVLLQLLERRHARRNSLVHQAFRVGLHQRLHAAADGFVAFATAQMVEFAVRPGCCSQQPVAGLRDVTVDQ